MKNHIKYYLLGVVILLLVLTIVGVMVNSNGLLGKNDIKKFTEIETWCGIKNLPMNPEILPGSGCFSLENGRIVLGKFAGHSLELKRSENGEVIYQLDGIVLEEHYDPKTAKHLYNSPFVITRGPYSWQFCNDKDHLECPLAIDFWGDIADKTAKSSIFMVAKCTGAEKNRDWVCHY